MNEIVKQLRALGQSARPILRKAAFASGKVVQEAIKAKTPKAKKERKVRGQVVTPGLLKSAIGLTVKQDKDKAYIATAGANVGRARVAKGATPIRGKSQAFYAHFLALNTAMRSTGEKTQRKTIAGKKFKWKVATGNPKMNRGRVAGFTWVRAAATGAMSKAEQAGIEVFEREIKKIAGGK